jgi:large subunit ribosomal protein L4
MKTKVVDINNKDSGEITLDKNVFGIEPKMDAIHSMVKYQLNKRQSGTHKTQERHEVSGTGKKPHAQKGTGRARAGDHKRNIDKGGQVAHGPKVRSHATDFRVVSNNLR